MRPRRKALPRDAWAEINVGLLLVPGLTGWAQINGRDELAIAEKVRLDAEYLKRQSTGFDMLILLMTAVKVVKGDGVTH
ncbi:sugar transferase [Herbaspirillum sp. GCM10030257]|uniref:sugar transferase n=1 Tax=Herbaspirillum sp. GCM10030257 TaxID=3273393 RepID=UPI003609A613